jgi:hypothetical protein
MKIEHMRPTPTNTALKHADACGLGFASNNTDEEWAAIAPRLTPPVRDASDITRSVS